MKTKQPSNVLTDQKKARKDAVRGWVLVAVFAPLFLVAFPDLFRKRPLDSADIGMTVLCGALMLYGLWKLFSCRRTKELQKRFRLFSGYFRSDPHKSVSGLCDALRLDRKTAEKDLTEMCARGYFDGYLDHKKDRLVFHSADAKADDQGDVMQCPGCGALNHVQKTGQHCRYCDSPLSLNP